MSKYLTEIFKKTGVVFLTLFLFCAFLDGKDKSYIGKWRGVDKGDIGYLTLTKDRYATFEFRGEIMGGINYDHSGIKASLKYKISTKKEPHQINFVIWDKKKAEEVGRLRGIFKMIDKDKMQMAINFSGSQYRPTNFSEDSIVFYRVSD
ncbi:hypothetical protein ACFQ1Q_11885 [Winogradskyella litorisediminis]|uniref:DUF2147 domain-containing protein n=1 Tax=Winogradskyella litorisediminis TaxID=1156618 RepID=A0ABW3N8F6_9FLAO